MSQYSNQNHYTNSFSDSGLPLENMSILSNQTNHVVPFNQQNSSTIFFDQQGAVDHDLVQEDKGQSLKFVQFINMLHRQHGRETRRLPRVGRKELDLYQLYMTVQKRGGYNAILQWKELGVDLGLPNTVTNAGYILRTKYEQFILPFERSIMLKYPPIRTPHSNDLIGDDENWIRPYEKNNPKSQYYDSQTVHMPKQMVPQQPFQSKLQKLFIKDFPFTDETFERIITSNRNITDLEIGSLEKLTKMPRVTVFPQHLTRLVLYNVPPILADQFLVGVSNLQLTEFNITVSSLAQQQQQQPSQNQQKIENRVEKYRQDAQSIQSTFPSSLD
ncbi:ARID1 AT-rich interaction domain protein [Spironucleus salmonicida]|uniref:ARID1 AT-rich interaction domain protein n=1 Tax=Spironucleus salmonicida TaxID=348837 RepID=V6LVL8_9EUKA|nr:ARID1 AT-rich interaction domain protein [Spironucleus salmonicida]|eukprot:EST48662.1 ARID1 AT-rich interaction domain protein [Spironucleus salmonicida]